MAGLGAGGVEAEGVTKPGVGVSRPVAIAAFKETLGCITPVGKTVPPFVEATTGAPKLTRLDGEADAVDGGAETSTPLRAPFEYSVGLATLVAPLRPTRAALVESVA